MTEERRQAIMELIRWYWNVAESENLLHNRDYEFLYDFWQNGLSFYDTDVQTRLNFIRDKYLQSQPHKKKTFKL